MADPFNFPEISVQEVARKRAAGESFILLDVREQTELDKAKLDGVQLAPTSQLSVRGLDALPESVRDDKDAEIVVMCRSGARSGQVTAWLRSHGWTNVSNMTGGILAWARHIDPSLPRY